MNSSVNGDPSPIIASASGLAARPKAGWSPSKYLTDCAGPPGVIAITTLPILGSSISACSPLPSNSGSRCGWVVRSSGLAGCAKGGSALRRPARVGSVSRGTSSPIRSQ